MHGNMVSPFCYGGEKLKLVSIDKKSILLITSKGSHETKEQALFTLTLHKNVSCNF